MIQDEDIIAICNIYSNSNNYKCLLHHFIKHYKNIKIDKIIFICEEDVQGFIKNNFNCSGIVLEKPKVFSTSSNLIEQIKKKSFFPAGLEKVSLGTLDSFRINSFKNKYNCWYVPLDLDEFHDIEDIHELKSECLSSGKQYVYSELYDRTTTDMSVPASLSSKCIFSQFPNHVDITGSIMKGNKRKVALCHPDVDVSGGHHGVTIEPFTIDKGILCKEDKSQKIQFRTFHFKWFGDFFRVDKEKREDRKSQNLWWFEEFDRLSKNNPFNL